ncbi:hypothetical protein M9H77_18020 [Catharanthus roseus]|uniref:Uncharacterized protein n=1 Tax=Catharanthus roseus TaxID=4058 RepID=A0ACC0B6G8_CATRO|nr:hypothetical protein M9H77_18020 [Catharanthus roseus]
MKFKSAKEQNCTWHVLCSTMTGRTSCQVKTLQDKHSCSRTFNHKLDFKSDNGVVVTEVQDKVQKELCAFDMCLIVYIYICCFHVFTVFLIRLDGCHLKGPYPGILLTAVGIHASNGIYPIVYAVVEDETKPNEWTDKRYILEHRFCVCHLHNNFKQRHPEESLKIQMWTCAKASYANKFEAKMEILKVMDTKKRERFCSHVKIILDKLKEAAAPCFHAFAGGSKFESERTYCSGRRWELCGISCAHVVAAMGLTAKEPKDYVDPCYNKEAFLRSHERRKEPSDGRKEAVANDQPKKLCKQTGHNARKCPTSQPQQQQEGSSTTAATTTRANSNRCGKSKAFVHNKRFCKSATSTSQAEPVENTQEDPFPSQQG